MFALGCLKDDEMGLSSSERLMLGSRNFGPSPESGMSVIGGSRYFLSGVPKTGELGSVKY